MQPCARPTYLFVVSCPDPTLASVTLSSHMTNSILLTQQNQEIAQWSPDPFPRERVGSGHETTGCWRAVLSNSFSALQCPIALAPPHVAINTDTPSDTSADGEIQLSQRKLDAIIQGVTAKLQEAANPPEASPGPPTGESGLVHTQAY